MTSATITEPTSDAIVDGRYVILSSTATPAPRS